MQRGINVLMDYFTDISLYRCECSQNNIGLAVDEMRVLAWVKVQYPRHDLLLEMLRLRQRQAFCNAYKSL